MKKETRRSQRVALLVREEISRLVLQVAHDPDLRAVTVTDVEMPPDLKSARVFFSCLVGENERERARKALERAAGYLRREVARRCALRYAPELHFHFDETLERGARIDALLAGIRPERADEEDEGDEGEGEEP
jgi:ribosome-binding factor A